jgi:thiol-disulfide isomerase/thioredoxin
LKKSLFLYLLLIPFCFSVSAQQADATGVTLQNIQALPAFKIMAAPDSTAYSSEQLQKNKPVIIIFFNPDCEHCQRETKELLAYKQELKDIQIVMITSLSFTLIKDFYKEYGIASMPNIVMGQDINYALRLKYRPTNFPGMYLYDANHKLAKVFAGNVGVPTMLDALK